MLRRNSVVTLVALVVLLSLVGHAWAAGPRGAIAACGLVLKKLEFSVQPNYPNDPNLYTDVDRLANDVQNVQNWLTDPLATGGWCDLIQDVLTLAGGTTAYFSDTGASPNQARDEFVQDWSRLHALAGCD